MLWEGLGLTLPPSPQHPFPGGCPGNQAWTPQLVSQAGANLLTSTTGSVEYCLRRSRTSGLPIAPRASPKETSQLCMVSMVPRGCTSASQPANQNSYPRSWPIPPEVIRLRATQALGQGDRVCQNPEARNRHLLGHGWPPPFCSQACIALITLGSSLQPFPLRLRDGAERATGSCPHSPASCRTMGSWLVSRSTSTSTGMARESCIWPRQ